MALFDTAPKSDPKFLYGRDKELETLSDHIKNKDWVILLGPRRIGKTSLAECTINKLGLKGIILDARKKNDFEEALLSSLTQPDKSIHIGANAKIPNTPIGVEIDYVKKAPKADLGALLDKTKRLVILVDEVQWFGNPKKVVMLLAHIYDYYYDKITFIITGSAVGVTRSIIDPGPTSALYGRALSKIEVAKWAPQVSIDFIREGCKEKGLSYSERLLLDVEKRLDGIPGWLTLFGYNYTQSKTANEALKQTSKEAFKIIAGELENLNKYGIGSEKQFAVLKVLTKGPQRFKDLSEETGFNDTTLSNHLDTLERLGYIIKNSKGSYVINDPVLEAYISEKV
jgi:AAA+ ATPase superfamily predicted ATPase